MFSFMEFTQFLIKQPNECFFADALTALISVHPSRWGLELRKIENSLPHVWYLVYVLPLFFHTTQMVSYVSLCVYIVSSTAPHRHRRLVSHGRLFLHLCFVCGQPLGLRVSPCRYYAFPCQKMLDAYSYNLSRMRSSTHSIFSLWVWESV